MPWNVRLLDAALALGARLPLRVLHALGAGLACVIAGLRTREYRVARRNVQLCFPALDAPARRAMLRATLAETGKSLLELAALWGGKDRSRALALVREVRGLEHFERARAAGRGVLVAAPHLGSWELLNLWLSQASAFTLLYRVPQHADYEVLLNRSRTALGAEAVRAEPAGVRTLLRRLREGRVVGILPDQRPKGGEGVDGPFFGHPVRTMTLLSRLAARSGAPVVFAFAQRLAKGAGFVVHFVPAEDAIADEDPVVAVTALNRGIEACIAIAPEQYQWTYKRLSFRPVGSGPDRIYGRTRWFRRRRTRSKR